jgi:hypothetical protein
VAKTRKRRRTPRPVPRTTAADPATRSDSPPASKRDRLQPARRDRPPGRRPVQPPSRSRTSRLVVTAVAISLLLGGYYLWQLHQAHRPPPPATFLSPAPSLSQPALSGLQTGPAPWSIATSTLRARLEAIGFPALPSEGSALHIHQHLDIFVEGRQVTVPAEIGINVGAGFISPIHTHTDDGLIHVESNVDRRFDLGQVFDVWGVRFTSTCLGGYCDQGDRRLRVYVEGKLIRGDPRLLVLASHQEIVVTYGTTAQLPRPVPSSYSFPLGA